MPEYLSPGVYVEEVDAGPKPIEGVSTSTAGAVGVTLKGPTEPGPEQPELGKPVLVTSFADFQRIFGGFLAEPDPGIANQWALDPAEGGRWWLFPLAVKGFFDNGGQRLYVRRVFNRAWRASRVGLGVGVVSELDADASDGDTELRLRHLIGVQVGSEVLVFSSGNPIRGNPPTPETDPPTAPVFRVSAYDAARSRITLDRAVGQELREARDFVQIFPRTLPPELAAETTLTFRANSRGTWGDDLRIRVRPMTGATLDVLPDPVAGGNPFNTTVREQPAAGTAVIEVEDASGFGNNDHVQIGGRQFSITAVDAGQNTITIRHVMLSDPWLVDTAVLRQRQVSTSGVTHVRTQVAAAATDIDVDDATGFAVGDVLTIDGNPHTVTKVPANDQITIAAPGVPAATWDVDTEVRLRTATSATGTTTVRTQAAAGAATVDINDASGLAVGDVIAINGLPYTIATIPAANPTATITIAPTVAAPEGAMVRRVRLANAPGAGRIRVRGASRLYDAAIVELDNGLQKERRTVSGVEGDTVTLSANLANSYFEGHKLLVIEAEVGVRYEPLRDDGNGREVLTEEVFSNLRLTDDGTLSYLITHVNRLSKLVSVERGTNYSDNELTRFPCALNGHWAEFANGNQDAPVIPDDFVGIDGGSGARTGIQSLEDIDEISICLAPAVWSLTVRNALILHCETLKDRFAVLDPQDGLSIQRIRDFREPIDTKYAALYYPWIEVRDPSIRRNVIVGPSAHMAGIYARVDVERGVHKAPANEVIRALTRIAQDVTKREQDMLNPKGINALRYFPGRGNRVWGARTLSSDSSWKYINVRRLFIFVEESIDEGTQWVVFEPNDEPLWARVRQTVSNFLTTVWRSGALQGATADEAFFVKCDYTTMTQDDIDNGRLICVIGIAPVKPAEFVIFRIQQKTRETQNA